jgi:branched-chain amino acid transport system substrate-binding protein
MMVTRRWVALLIGALLAVALSAMACGPGQLKGEAIMYVAAPLSGFQANGGQTVLGGARLKAEEINKAGGLLGYKVVVQGLDDESDSEVALAVAEEVKAAIEEGKRVLGVIGHYNSGQTIAAMEIYKDLPIIIITPTASAMELTREGYSNFFRVNANNATQAQVDAEYLVNTLGSQRVAVVYNDDPYGIDLGELMAQELAQLGAEVVLSLQVAVEQSTFAQEVPQIKAAQPDAIFYGGYEVEAPYLVAELRAAGVNEDILASDGAFLSATIDEAGGAAEGIYVSGFAPSPEQVVSQEWIRAYQEVEYRNPDTYSINGYSALAVLAEGVKQAKTFDGQKVAQAIRQLRFDTPSAPIAYTTEGELQIQPIYIFQVQNDAFVQVAATP